VKLPAPIVVQKYERRKEHQGGKRMMYTQHLEVRMVQPTCALEMERKEHVFEVEERRLQLHIELDEARKLVVSVIIDSGTG
jgi:hypothetical protein